MRKHQPLLITPVLVMVIAQSLSAHPIAFTHVTIIDATRGQAQRDMTVVVMGDRITAVGETGKTALPVDVQAVNARGQFLIPGLWDMHVHILEAERTLPLFVANGITGVRNMGGIEKEVFQWRQEIASGKRLGPRMIACGPFLKGPGPSQHANMYIEVRDAAEGKQAVALLKARGADFIKVHNNLSREAYFAVAEEAKRVGLPFAGHVTSAVTVWEASNAGQESIEHLTGIPQYCSTPDAARQLFARFRENGTWQVPTLIAQ